ncbi:hypothetical protein CHS0354_038781 [Potamilus streckersoni]|uniref:Uncharacterized protein n=1 Tax=Potamilus streckersoni TaxID=2493646 RepID=A0AAE0SS66_9BIVA|nr:hypothetical protein CHS0354_038781 [Potamilus streckersoni]
MRGFCSIIAVFFIAFNGVHLVKIGEGDIEYEFRHVDFTWSNKSMKEAYVANRTYVVENCLISGIKIYKGNVYVTVPRWRNGVPATLNRVVRNVTGNESHEAILEPFPSWEMNKLGDCRFLQYAQSMEIDPNTGWMWIIDAGRINLLPIDGSSPQNLCPAKLIIVDINKNRVVRSYEFPNEVVNRSSNFLNDIVLDYVNGQVQFAYITDTIDAKIVVYDYLTNSSYMIQHPSMLGGKNFPVAGINVNGIALSYDFTTLFFCPLSSLNLYKVPTLTLRTRGDFNSSVVNMGQRRAQTGGMVAGQRNLYYGALFQHGVDRLPVEASSAANSSNVITRNDTIIWVDSLAFDGEYLWFVANNFNDFKRGMMTFNSSKPNMRIWKVGDGEIAYEFSYIDYVWRNESIKQSYISNSKYILENCMIAGIKVYKNNVYVTVPRWRMGVPATLNRVVMKRRENGSHIPVLEPFPSWETNTLGDCRNLQYVQSMEIDHNTGWMWIIDPGRINLLPVDGSSPQNLCPAKLVIFDINLNRIVQSYTFPNEVVNRSSNFINDIVLDYVNGKASFAYISDAFDAKIVVYDHINNSSYAFHHSSMVGGTNFPVAGINVDGIAITSDFSTVFYCALSSLVLYKVPTSTLRTRGGFDRDVAEVGQKRGITGGIVAGQRYLYYGLLFQDGVDRLPVDAPSTVSSSNLITRNGTLTWADTLAFDGEYLWVVANNLNEFRIGNMTFNGSETIVRIWKVFVGERGYLTDASTRTLVNGAGKTGTYHAVTPIQVVPIG